MILSFTEVILDKIGSLLSAKDLLRLCATCKSLKEYYEKDIFWQKIMFKNLWFEKHYATFKSDIQFLLNNSPNCLYETSQPINEKNVHGCVFSHKGTTQAAYGDDCDLWIIQNDVEIFYVTLSKKRMWRKIVSVSFSPDDHHLMVTGTVNHVLGGSNGRETLIYKIEDEWVTMKSWVVLENDMSACWYNNSNILYMANEHVESRVRIFISSIDNSADIMVYPILTFNKKIVRIMVAQEVSPRTRKVVQIANQAADEGRTLAEKLVEIGEASGINTSDMTALKAILDQNDECMPCYKLHAHHDAVQASDCSCECHHNTDKLLIFYGNDSSVHAKVITEKVLENAKEAFVTRGETEHQDHHRLFFPLAMCMEFDALDYSFNIPGSLLRNDSCFSPNYRYLYVTSTEPTLSQINVTCLDLATMVVRNTPKFSSQYWNKQEFDVKITANNHFVTLFTDKKVLIYSALHHGNAVDVLNDFYGFISSVTIHPYLNKLVVTNNSFIHIYHSAEYNKMLEEEEEET